MKTYSRFNSSLFVLIIQIVTLCCSSSRVQAQPPEIVYAYYDSISPDTLVFHAAFRPFGQTVIYWNSYWDGDWHWSFVYGTDYATEDTTFIEFRESKDKFCRDDIYYWFCVDNGVDSPFTYTHWQLCQRSVPTVSPALYKPVFDSVTSTSFHARVRVKTNGIPTTLRCGWSMDPPPNRDVRTITLPALPDDTTLSFLFNDLMPYQHYPCSASLQSQPLPSVIQEIWPVNIRTQFDSSVTSFAIPMAIKAYGGLYRPNLAFGVHSYAHYSYDYILGENRLPPPAPGWDIRFIGGHHGSGPDLSDGSYIDIHPFFSESQSDTFKIRLIALEEHFPIVFQWQNLQEFYSGPVTMTTFEDTVDMLTTNSFTLNNASIGLVTIIAQHPKQINFRPSILAKTDSLQSSTQNFLTSVINPNGSDGTTWFEWGTSTLYESSTEPDSLAQSFAVSEHIRELHGLQSGTIYHYRAVVQTSQGKYYGMDSELHQESENGIFSPVDIINHYSLLQNYPNPFNPKTKIRFDLPKASYVTLKVFNLLGQEVATLADEKKEAGSYEIQFDGSMLTSGMYFYRLQTKDYTNIKKFLLLK